MLVIRTEQVDVLSASMRIKFEQRVIEHLRAVFPDKTKHLPDEKIHSVVRDSIRKAESYGVEYEDDIRRFIEYMVIYGTQLDVREQTQWVGDILRRSDLDGTAKMDLIDTRELQKLREQM